VLLYRNIDEQVLIAWGINFRLLSSAGKLPRRISVEKQAVIANFDFDQGQRIETNTRHEGDKT